GRIGHILDDPAGAVLFQQGGGHIAIPGRMTEFDRYFPCSVRIGECDTFEQTLELRALVGTCRRRQLYKKTAFRRREIVYGIHESFHVLYPEMQCRCVGNTASELDGDPELVRDLINPFGKGRRLRDLIKAAVDFNGIEERRVISKSRLIAKLLGKGLLVRYGQDQAAGAGEKAF